MNTPPDPHAPLVIRQYPFALGLFGLIFCGVGLYLVFGNRGTALFGMLFVGIGLLVLLWLAAVVTITVDKASGLLTIVSQYVLRRTYKEFEIRSITGVEVASQLSHSSRGGTTTVYNVQLVLADGQCVDISPTYSSGLAGKERTASRLRDYLGLKEMGIETAMLTASLKTHDPAFQPAGPQQQAGADLLKSLAASEPPEPAYQTTAGVSWRMVADERNPAQFGGLELQRWFSPDFKFANGFLYLVQKPKGSPAFGTGGLLGGVSKTLYQVSLRLFGFDEEHTPGFDQAELLQPPEPRLEKDYLALTTDSYAARQVLNPWATLPLAQWAERYPVKQVQNRADGGQLAVLFSPLGVYVACIGPNPAQRAALTDLGIELVRAQGGGGV